MDFIKRIWRTIIFNYGLSTFICVVIVSIFSIIHSFQYDSGLSNLDFMSFSLYIFVTSSIVSVGIDLINPRIRNQKKWTQRGIIYLYCVIIAIIISYCYYIIRNIEYNPVMLLVITPGGILFVSLIVYIIYDVHQRRKIKKINQSLSEYNKSNDNNNNNL